MEIVVQESQGVLQPNVFNKLFTQSRGDFGLQKLIVLLLSGFKFLQHLSLAVRIET